MVFNFVLTDNNTILPCLFFFFLIIDLHFLITTVIAKYFNPTEEHLIPRGITTEEAKAEIETSQ